MTDHQKQAQRLYPEDRSASLALEESWRSNGMKLRDHFSWTEQQAEEAKKGHAAALKGVVGHADVEEVHTMLTDALTKPVPAEKEATEQREKLRHEMMAKGRQMYGRDWDRVFARAQQNIEANPHWKTLVEHAGPFKSVRVAEAIFRHAYAQIQKGK